MNKNLNLEKPTNSRYKFCKYCRTFKNLNVDVFCECIKSFCYCGDRGNDMTVFYESRKVESNYYQALNEEWKI